MLKPVPLVVELCAGLASLSRYIEHGDSPPPVSRMGRKWAYRKAIAGVMGLRPRQKAERYLWAEADGDVAALLAAYTQPEVMREIAAIIRSWIPCPYGAHAPDPSCSRCKGTGRWDARDLWEVLRREKRRGLWEGFAPADVAAWTWTEGRSIFTKGSAAGFLPEHSSNGVVVWNAHPPEHFARTYDASARPWPPVLIAQDAAVDVGSVAGWALHHAWSYAAGSGVDGYAGPGSGSHPVTQSGVLTAFQPWVWPPTVLTPSASIPPPPLPTGTVCYIDPPYLNTTGYKADFTRVQVCEAAERWATAGARVYISEAEPIAALGWHKVEISGERKGQTRTFSRSDSEWLTCSHPPAWTPPVQRSLFGVRP